MLLLGASPAAAAPAEVEPLGPQAADGGPPLRPAAVGVPAIVVTGHGYGHGRGLGQWGALGYAVDRGWSAPQILEHYYGGTTAGRVPNSTVGVRLVAQDGQDTVVWQERGRLATTVDSKLAPMAAGATAVRVVRTATNTAAVFDGPGCSGPWRQRGVVVGAVSVTRTVGGDDRRDMLGVCDAAGVRVVRGAVRSVLDGRPVTVNDVAVEDYLRGVVPRESPASWGDAGNGKGAAALQAQAVAARSYGLAERRSALAQTCDTTACQVYDGVGTLRGGVWTPGEDPRTDAAVRATSGQVRLLGGVVARTEFSASTGGWSAGGTFPAVVDDGDATAANGNHTWSTTVDVGAIERTYGKGQLLSVAVTARNGLGADGGRATSVRLGFAAGPVTVSGEAFRLAFGLRSSWFTLSMPPVASPPPPVLAPADAGYLLRSNGSFVPVGAAPGLPAARGVAAGTARAAALLPSGRGLVLSADGVLHPIADTPVPAGGPSWPGQDVARDVALRADGRGGYILDGNGGLHPFGGAPKLAGSSWRPGLDLARRLVLSGPGDSGYVLGSDGLLSPVGRAPAVAGPGVASAAVVLSAGRPVTVTAAGRFVPALVAPRAVITGTVVDGAARPDATSGYLLLSGGRVVGLDLAPVRSPSTPDAVRVVLARRTGGLVLDRSGGLHPFGGAAPVSFTGWWPGQDITIAVDGHGGAGQVLDYAGGLHPFAERGQPLPEPVTDFPYWPGRRVARDLVLLPGSSRAGYVLDLSGGLHPVGGAPVTRGGTYWAGQDIARRVALLPDGTGGYVLDVFGGLHPFAVGSNPVPPAVTPSGYWPGWRIARGLVVTGRGQGFTVDGWGGLHGFGGVRPRGTFYAQGRDVVADVAGEGLTSAVVVDRSGGVHPTNPADPDLPGGAVRWPGQDVVRGTLTW